MIAMSERVPPQDQGAEMCVLGAVFLQQENIPAVAEIVSPDDFYRPQHGTLFRVICGMFADRKPIDLVTLRAELERKGLLQEAGGSDYLCVLVEGVPDTRNVEYYAQIVREKSGRRKIISFTWEMAQKAHDATDYPQLLEEMQSRVYAMAQARTGGSGLVSAASAVDEFLAYADRVQRGEVPPGLMTGFVPIDNATGGFQPGDLVTLAAATGLGKSAFAMSTVMNVAGAGGAVLYISAEMETRELGKRLVQASSGVSGQTLRYGKKLTPSDWTRLHQASGKLAGQRIELLCVATTVADIVLKARQLAARWGEPLSLIVVDYLQLMRHTTGETRAQQVGGIAWGLKQAAMDLGTPILMLSQFDRAGVKQTDATPTIHNLKESGDIENHSNTILLLHKPAKTEWEDDETMQIWCKIAKARDGLVTPWDDSGAIRLLFKPAITRFVGAKSIGSSDRE